MGRLKGDLVFTRALNQQSQDNLGKDSRRFIAIMASFIQELIRPRDSGTHYTQGQERGQEVLKSNSGGPRGQQMHGQLGGV